jgi:predicted PurR-regulated permease PerM
MSKYQERINKLENIHPIDMGGIVLKESYTKWFLRFVILLLAFSSIYVFMKLQPIWYPITALLKTVFTPFFIAAFITYLLHPVVEKIHQNGIPRPLAILLIYIIFFGGIGYGIYKGVPVIIQQLKDLLENYPQFVRNYRNWVDTIHSQTSNWPDGLHERVEQGFIQIERWLEQVIENIAIGLTQIFDSILLFALIPFLVFYLLKDFNEVKKAVWYLTPTKWRKPGIRFLKDIDQSLGNYIRGQLFVCFVIGIAASIGLWISGMRYPLLLGSIIGITNIIPYFGPFIGAVPAVIIAATISFKMVLIVAGMIFILQFLEGNILSPLIVGKSLHMHPIVIMFALLFGGEAGGVLGLILAVPILAVLKVTILHAKAHFLKH